jgi:hypothetical protein
MVSTRVFDRIYAKLGELDRQFAVSMRRPEDDNYTVIETLMTGNGSQADAAFVERTVRRRSSFTALFETFIRELAAAAPWRTDQPFLAETQS